MQNLKTKITKDLFHTRILQMFSEVSTRDELNIFINQNQDLFLLNPYRTHDFFPKAKYELRISELRFQENALDLRKILFSDNSPVQATSSNLSYPGWKGTLWIKPHQRQNFETSCLNKTGIHVDIGGHLRLDIHLFAHDFKKIFFQSFTDDINTLQEDRFYSEHVRLIQNKYKAMERYPELILNHDVLVNSMREFFRKCMKTIEKNGPFYKDLPNYMIEFERKALEYRVNQIVCDGGENKKIKI